MTAKIGAVAYLNTKPLIYGLEKRLANAGALSLDLPSRLADDLQAGRLVVALIPSIEFFRHPGYKIISNACIACRGNVRSVKVVFRKPPQEVESIAWDEGSRTSVALAQILLHRRFGIHPETKLFPIADRLESTKSDACLVIGDRAMKIDDSQFHEVWDLGEEWLIDTGLPFVFAMWVARESFHSPDLEAILEECRDDGFAHIDELSTQYCGRYGLTFDECKEYLGHHLQFRLDEKQREGLSLYRELAKEQGLIPDGSPSGLLERAVLEPL